MSEWSPKHKLTACRICESSEEKHYAVGKCEGCFRRDYNRRWIRAYRKSKIQAKE